MAPHAVDRYEEILKRESALLHKQAVFDISFLLSAHIGLDYSKTDIRILLYTFKLIREHTVVRYALKNSSLFSDLINFILPAAVHLADTFYGSDHTPVCFKLICRGTQQSQQQRVHKKYTMKKLSSTKSSEDYDNALRTLNDSLIQTANRVEERDQSELDGVEVDFVCAIHSALKSHIGIIGDNNISRLKN